MTKMTRWMLAGLLLTRAWAWDIDSGHEAIRLAKVVGEASPLVGGTAGWVRVRWVDLTKPDETRAALLKLRAAGLRTCVMLRWPGDWKGGNYLPKDLREAHEHWRKLGAAFGDLVDAWEIDNEPDTGFVPENAERYAAFFKAQALGLKEGYRLSGERLSGGRSQLSDRRYSLSGKSADNSAVGAQSMTGSRGENASIHGSTNSQQPITSNSSAPLVLMAALGLPPGAWFERFVANDGLSYTDGFNYHYYGFAEDFTAAYRSFESATQELLDGRYSLSGKKSRGLSDGVGRRLSDGSYLLSGNKTNSAQPITNNSAAGATDNPRTKKSLPIFLTETGYGRLGNQARNALEGRLRQWRWFQSVGEQAGALRIEAPMAFYLQPYFEHNHLEFGLTAIPKPETVPLLAAASPVSVPAVAGQRDLKPEGDAQKSKSWMAGGIRYRPEDFNAEAQGREAGAANLKSGETDSISGLRSQVSGLPVAPWMENIGRKIGGNEVTPALAAWLGERTKTKAAGIPSRSWEVTVAAPSPVVIDFLAGAGLQPLKHYNAYSVTWKEREGPKPPDPRPQTPHPKSPTPNPKPKTPDPAPPPARRELIMVQVRTANGNLFQVYPSRTATSAWQTYLEPHSNFSQLTWGRTALPWRFAENRPAALSLVMYYPKQLPAVFEFRRMKLVRLAAPLMLTNPEIPRRYGRGRVVLYNFADHPVRGRLAMEHGLQAETPETDDEIVLAPGERREVPVVAEVPWVRFERQRVPVTFTPADAAVPVARLQAEFFADIGGMHALEIAPLLQGAAQQVGERNRTLLLARPLAREEVRMGETGGLLASPGVIVERTADGFTVTIPESPLGREQRHEIEVPWPDGLGFPEDGFLSMEYRLRPTSPEAK